MVTTRFDDSREIVMTVSDFVAVLNQTIEYAFPNVVVTGELTNLRVSKNKWVYFDLKDEFSSVKCFGTVYILPGPLEDGMLLNVRAVPRLHNQFGFSLNIMNIQLAGEGSIRKAAELLEGKLVAEGLFEPSRKRPLPYPPVRIGLVASGESAAYADFMKILNTRWRGVGVIHADVQVQGEAAPGQIIAAIEQLNSMANPPDVIVITRGGGSAEDLQAFSTEQVTRSIAASRVPTLVAIGHEVDISLAELAADLRASTPSNAAEILVPDRITVLNNLVTARKQLNQKVRDVISNEHEMLLHTHKTLLGNMEGILASKTTALRTYAQLLDVLSPQAILLRGYAIVRKSGMTVRQTRQLTHGDIIDIGFADGSTQAIVRKGK